MALLILVSVMLEKFPTGCNFCCHINFDVFSLLDCDNQFKFLPPLAEITGDSLSEEKIAESEILNYLIAYNYSKYKCSENFIFLICSSDWRKQSGCIVHTNWRNVRKKIKTC